LAGATPKRETFLDEVDIEIKFKRAFVDVDLDLDDGVNVVLARPKEPSLDINADVEIEVMFKRAFVDVDLDFDGGVKVTFPRPRRKAVDLDTLGDQTLSSPKFSGPDEYVEFFFTRTKRLTEPPSQRPLVRTDRFWGQ